MATIYAIYCTTYCNRGHRLHDGKPVDHECVILPPAMLVAERFDDFDEARRLLAKAKQAGKLRTMRRGVRA